MTPLIPPNGLPALRSARWVDVALVLTIVVAILLRATPLAGTVLPVGIAAGSGLGLLLRLASTVRSALRSRSRSRMRRRSRWRSGSGPAPSGQTRVTDRLTGAPTRDDVEKTLAQAAATRPAGLLMVEIDHVSCFNAEHGMGGGDQVIVESYRRMAATIRRGDVLGRWGGATFCLVAPGVADSVALDTVAEKVRRAVSAAPTVLLDGEFLYVTVSSGAVVVEPGTSPAAAITRARRRLESGGSDSAARGSDSAAR